MLQMFGKDNQKVIEYKGYFVSYYMDYIETDDEKMEFHNLEIWKDNRMLRHATVGRELSEEDLVEYIKNYLGEDINKGGNLE